MVIPALQQRTKLPLRLGFVPLSDCAPIAVAMEMGIFERYGLSVVLSRELGSASVRDKIFLQRHLKAGHIDGYCVGEPWNSESILAGSGWSPARSSDLSHGHPEKVLLVSGKFLHERKDDSIALVAALLDACKMCQDPAFRNQMVSCQRSPKVHHLIITC